MTASQQPVGLEHLHHLVELFIGPIRGQLVDAALNSGLADGRGLYGLRRQQRPWLTDVIEQVHGNSFKAFLAF